MFGSNPNGCRILVGSQVIQDKVLRPSDPPQVVEDDQVLKLQVRTRQVQVQVDNLATLRLAGYRGWQASCCQLLPSLRTPDEVETIGCSLDRSWPADGWEAGRQVGEIFSESAPNRVTSMHPAN